MAVEKALSEPLSDHEMERLDRLLAERLGASLETGDSERDEGVLSLSELDGFLTAVVSGPEAVVPSVWLPAVWGEYEPRWQSEDELLGFFTLMVRHMNAIAAHLLEEPGSFEPMFLSHVVDGRDQLVVEDWCLGYVRAIALSPEAWRDGGKGIESLLQPIFSFGTQEGWRNLDALPEDRRESLQQEITPSVRAIHDFWLERRRPGAGKSHEPFRHSSPRIGRNDPCPCGSGKKFKNCCLH